MRNSVGPLARVFFAASAFLLATSPSPARQPPASAGAANPSDALDNRHGFDFMLGSWNAHFRLLRHPLSGSKAWIAFDGTIVDRSVLNFVNFDEGVLYRPAGPEHAVTVRVYSEKTRQWSIYFGTDVSGALALPATVGSFDRFGVGRFYDREPYHGRPIVVRYLWTHRSANACHYEQAFSADGGRTWETNWISDLTRRA